MTPDEVAQFYSWAASADSRLEELPSRPFRLVANPARGTVRRRRGTLQKVVLS